MELFARMAMIHSIVLFSFLVYKKRSIRAAYITFLSIAVSFYLIGNYIEISNASILAASVGLVVRFIAIPFIPTLWLLSVREFCGVPFKGRVIALLIVIPTIAAYLAINWEHSDVFFKSVHYLNDDHIGNLYITPGPLYRLFLAYSYAINLWGIMTLIRSFREGTKKVKQQTRLFLASALLPVFTVGTYIVKIHGYNVDVTPYGLLISLTFFVFALFKFGVLNLSYLVKEKAIDNIQEGLILFDHEGLYLESNSAAQNIIPSLRRMKIGMNLVEAEGLPFGPSIFELEHKEDEPAHEFSVENEGESKTYSISTSRIYHDKKVVGYSIVLNNITLFKSMLSSFKEKSITDPLTGVYNRAFLFEKGEASFENFKYSKEWFSVIMLDIDFFKKVNDTHGHVYGDYVLKALAAICTAHLRKSDLLARYGGEEFCVLLFSSSLEHAHTKAELLRHKISEYTFNNDGISIQLTASFGVASITEKDASFLDIVKRADANLYKAKETGRNRVC